MSRSRRRRGYPVAVLIGLENDKASLWNIYSRSIKPDTSIKQEKNLYNYFEAIIDQLRGNVKQGVKTVLVASPDVKNYEAFYQHIEKHQRWLIAGYELNENLPLIGVSIWDMLIAVVAPIVGVSYDDDLDHVIETTRAQMDIHLDK